MKDRSKVNNGLCLPLGRLGVPPEAAMTAASENVLIIARLTDSQLEDILKIVNRNEKRLYQ